MDRLLFICIRFTLFSFFSKFSTAVDTLIPSQLLKDNQTIVSSGQTFELGFFSSGNSKNRYLGIWYKNIPIKTVVWVANRDNPIKDSSGGVLKIDINGNLVLLVNGTNSVFWSSSNYTNVGNTIAQLLELGNLILKPEDNDDPKSYLWQSIDHPSDTVLENTRFGYNPRTGLNRKLTSRKSPDDPSSGDFTYSVELQGLPEFVLRKGSVEQFHSGSWNGLRFSGTPKMTPNVVSVFNSEEVYFLYENISNIPVLAMHSRFALNPSGLLQHLTWNNQTMEWDIILSEPKEKCDVYGKCGAYGICDIVNPPMCQCLMGFTPPYSYDWGFIDPSGGCFRRTQSMCYDQDTFVKFSSVKLPDTSMSRVNKKMSLNECEVVCLNNCSCTAFANSDIRGAGTGCVLWHGDLIDIKQVIDGGQDLYVRTTAPEVISMDGHYWRSNVPP